MISLPRYASRTRVVGGDLGRRSFGEHAAAIEDGDAVREREHDAHVVLDEQDGQAEAVVQIADDAHDARRLRLGQSRHRLVEQHERRLGREAHRDLAQALAAVREFGDEPVLARASG